MPENEIQGISRRDLLKRGAALGGAVVWATPVVQTLGMGRAFAQSATPVGDKDISYLAIEVDCLASGGEHFVVKFDGDNGWELGNTPDCAVGNATALGPDKGIVVVQNGPCWDVTVPEAFSGCTVTAFPKAGQTCTPVTITEFGSPQEVCSSAG